MIIFGYAVDTRTSKEGVLEVQTRVPVIHGPYKQSEYQGRSTRGYVLNANLPWYQSIELPRVPHSGDVLALTPLDDGKSEFLVVGLMGSSASVNVGGSK